MLIAGNPSINMSKAQLLIYLLSPQISPTPAFLISADPSLSQHPSNWSNLGQISLSHIPRFIHQQHLLAPSSEDIQI